MGIQTGCVFDRCFEDRLYSGLSTSEERSVNLNPEALTLGIVQYVCLLFSLSMHEAAHAITADRCGDPSARLLGRATLNPIAHIDPVGTVIMPILMMISGIPYLFGWAKPVPMNPANLRNIRRDPAWSRWLGRCRTFSWR